MYEQHEIKCTSCGKIFLSELNDTLCEECLKATSNRSKTIKQ